MLKSEARKFSDSHMEKVKKIVGPFLMEVSTEYRDMNHCSDLTVTPGVKDIGYRIRTDAYAARYPWDVTIRSKLSNGAKTELAKIVDGEGDLFFYGHSAGGVIHRWFLLDCDGIRDHLRDGPIRHVPNFDGTFFYPMDVRKVSGAVISSSHKLPEEQLALI